MTTISEAALIIEQSNLATEQIQLLIIQAIRQFYTGLFPDIDDDYNK